LPQRDAGKGFVANLRKSAPKLKLYARTELFANNKVRFAFLIDAYLAYGNRVQKKDELLAVIGGLESEFERFPVDILVFNQNGLVRTQENTLPPTSNHSFPIDCNGIVQGLRVEHPGIRIIVAAPLSAWTMADVEYEDKIPFDKLSFKPLTSAKAAQDRYGLPVATMLAGAAIFSVMTASGWSEFSSARERYAVASSDPALKKQGGVDTNYLNVMTQRRQFMEAPRRQDLLSNKTMDIIRGISAVPNVKIVEIKMPAPSLSAATSHIGVVAPSQLTGKDAPNQVPDVWMKISVPKSDGPAIYQARDLVRALIESTGMSIRTAPDGWAEENGRRVFMLEGFIDA
jgi:hypothetical protein